MRPYLDGLALTSLSLLALGVAVVEGVRPAAASVAGMAVVFAPWTAPEAVMIRSTAAGARFVGFGPMPFVAIVVPDEADYASRAEIHGAWMVAAADRFPGCQRPVTMEPRQ